MILAFCDVVGLMPSVGQFKALLPTVSQPSPTTFEITGFSRSTLPG